ncbi:MAG: FAD-dependent oxidoreductase, partial [Oscillospiraceae bacterium]|nr:FAD-dependent oxidoreductase [Oscillospiraceae bacterium]
MANMTLTKTPMPEQDPQVRARNFKEVALGYTAEQAIEEAGRCLKCKNPKCVEGCPVNVRIPEFIAKVQEGDFKAAYEIITSTNALPALSGRVCPQESQCEARCVRGIKGEPVAIGRLERFVADWYRENVNEMPEKTPSNGMKVAVVGSGPAGMTAASDLAKKGYEVTMFEALHTAGGVLVYGIPEFRLPKAIVANEVKKLQAQGVEVMTNMVIGRVLTIDELFEMGYKAVFVGSGAGLPMFGPPQEGAIGDVALSFGTVGGDPCGILGGKQLNRFADGGGEILCQAQRTDGAIGDLHPLMAENDPRIAVFIHIQGAVQTHPVAGGDGAFADGQEGTHGAFRTQDLRAAHGVFGMEADKHIISALPFMHLGRPEIPVGPEVFGAGKAFMGIAPCFQ